LWADSRYEKTTGPRPDRYTILQILSIAKAQQLLASTDKSILDISQETGFCDQSYFGLVFRQLVHMTPLQYRKTFRGSVNVPFYQNGQQQRPAITRRSVDLARSARWPGKHAAGPLKEGLSAVSGFL
jgi:AraC-like DNA-binding protein